MQNTRMPDQGSPGPHQAGASSRGPAVASKSTGFAPPGHAHALRRSNKPVDDGQPTPPPPAPPPMRRKSHASRSEASNEGQPPPPHDAPPPRRSSNFSEYNLDEARNLLNPTAQTGHETSMPESSSLASLSLAFALLPAIAGVLFKDGHVLVTDIMLLGLSGVFLHWSVTQPWVWYHSAQQVRIQQQTDTEDAIDEDVESDDSAPDTAQHKTTSLDDVPEEEAEEDVTSRAADGRSGSSQQDHPSTHLTTTPQQQSALRELYIHEVLALLSCFALPPLSAYLLHYIRVQLSRPSEGLVSNYNLTIFLLVSELRAFSHTIKLIKSRTLHLQRILHGADPFGAAPVQPAAQMEEMLERLGRLEARSLAHEFVREHSDDMAGSSPAGAEQRASLAMDVRRAIQPELDALNRAVRRYEKKATLLQHQTDARFSALDSRLDDAIALAAVAARNSSGPKNNIFVRALEPLLAAVLFPFTTLLHLFTLPLRFVLGLVNARKSSPVPAKHARSSRAGKQPGSSQPRYSGDRVPGRVMKR